MPITPFHFGPGALIKAAAPSRVSWTVFAFANCAIDIETISYFVVTGIPQHGHLHSFAGATALGLLLAVPARRICEAWLRWWNRQQHPEDKRWLGTSETITPFAAYTGALLGGWTHVFLDGIMHADVKPFWPLQASNPFHLLISIDALHLACAISGAVAIALLALQRIRS